MCGIVGYVGKGTTLETLINGLRRLEYRGYDSAGLAVADDDGVHTIKTVGRVDLLDERVREQEPGFGQDSGCGIAHTRWATHGAPSEVNAHPHLDGSGRFALVHNGIIENYRSLYNHLSGLGHHFASETDSEVLAHLIEECYEGEVLQALCAALQKVQGTFGIALLCQDAPGQIYVARRGSPLVIGIGNEGTMIASDAPAVVTFTRQVIYLQDDDVAVVGCDCLDVRNVHNVPVSREISHLDWDEAAARKDGYEHFMLKEILEQPEALHNTVSGRLDMPEATAVLNGLGLGPRELADVQRTVLLACGTSLYAGMAGSYFFEDLADVPAAVEQAAEFRSRNPIVRPRDLAFAISQSGETADTLAALREALRKGALVAGICNVVGSSIARETGRGVYLHAGPEIGVASTKAFTCQVAVLLMLALKLGRSRRLSKASGEALCAEIEQIPDTVKSVLQLNDGIAAVAQNFADAHNMFFIGRGYGYPPALEGALKLKEISYIHAEGYHAAELKHGPIALLDPDVPVVAVLTDIPGRDKTLGNVHECRARGAPVLAIITEEDEEVQGVADHEISLPRTSHYLSPITTVVAFQLFAYHIARLRGCDIDKPRNLAKSVTVE